MVKWYKRPWFCFVLKRGKCISLTPYVGGHSQPFQGTDGIFRLHKISLAPRVPLRFYPVKPCTISCTLFKMWCTFWFSKFIPQKILSTACVGWLERYRILPNKILAHNNDNDIADPEYLNFLFEQTFGILLLVITFLKQKIGSQTFDGFFVGGRGRQQFIWWMTRKTSCDTVEHLDCGQKIAETWSVTAACRALHFDKRKTFDFLHTVVGKRSRSVSKVRGWQCK